MGRMIDIMRSADRRSGGGPEPEVRNQESGFRSQDSGVRSRKSEVRDDEREVDEGAAEEPNLSLTSQWPPIEDDDDVPFIEVGGPREPNLRLVAAPTPEKILTPRPPSSEGKGEEIQKLLPPFPSAERRPTLFTIRFQPIHAAQLGGRCPVAELIAFHQPDHPVSGQYRSLAAEIARQLPGALPRILLFTGATDGVGTSTVLLNLAMTLARQEAKVTVVDAHQARPALAARLGLPDGPGLGEVLAGKMPLQWCLQETAHPNLFVLPAGTAGTPREGVDTGAILQMLRNRSDCVLLDAGPWADNATAAELAAGCDAVYLVLPHERAATPDTMTLQEEILTETGRLRGCVLTQK
jgi:Mrp family chromosome partitioning ATPase